MNYYVTVNGENRTLPARTPEVDDRIIAIQNINRRIRSGEITRREARQEQYNFVVVSTRETLPPLDQMDLGDLEAKVAEIIAAYQRPAIQAKVEASLDVLKDVMNRPEVKNLFAALDKVSKESVKSKASLT